MFASILLFAQIYALLLLIKILNRKKLACVACLGCDEWAITPLFFKLDGILLLRGKLWGLCLGLDCLLCATRPLFNRVGTFYSHFRINMEGVWWYLYPVCIRLVLPLGTLKLEKLAYLGCIAELGYSQLSFHAWLSVFWSIYRALLQGLQCLVKPGVFGNFGNYCSLSHLLWLVWMNWLDLIDTPCFKGVNLLKKAPKTKLIQFFWHSAYFLAQHIYFGAVHYINMVL